jgi:polysaccharide biosynthesis transport protein
MTAPDSKRTAEFMLTAETGMETPAQFRTDASFLQEPGTDSFPTPPARNFLAEVRHALRRHWLAAIVAGAVVASITSSAIWFSVTPQYTATAVLRVSVGPTNVIELSQHGSDGANSFDVYKRTQKQLLRSPNLLTSVLQNKSVSSLPLVLQQPDPLWWLQDIIKVTFPDESEIMYVSVRCEDQATAETLADTTVDVYLREVVYVERQEKMDRITHLQNAETETEASLRKKRNELRTLADTMGTGDSEALTAAQKNTLQEYSALWSKLNQVELDLNRAKRARQERGGSAAVQSAASISVSNDDVEAFAATDPLIAAAKAQLDRLQIRIDDAGKDMFGSAQTEFVAGCQSALERIRKRIEDRKAVLRKELVYKKKSQAEAAGDVLAMSVQELAAQQKELKEKVAALQKEAEKFGRSSVDVELMRAEIKALDTLRDRIQRELHEANIEISSLKPRVVQLSSAKAFHSSEANRRLTLSAGSGGFGVFAGCALVVLWDLRRRRLNNALEIAKAIRLPLLGTLPHASRRAGAIESSSAWTEAISGIVARLVFSPSDDSQQVILVTSASAGEGKTTVAVNLATSLAGMGQKTVLVDFDLRRPRLHEMFDLGLTPGVGAILEGQLETLDAVLATSVENLFLLPAGAWDQRGLSRRDDDQVGRIVRELRASFVHVVIDSGPVLPVVDTRVVARHADGVIVALLRDVTEIPKVSSACELLRSFDIRILGAVMIGGPGEVYYPRAIAELPETA